MRAVVEVDRRHGSGAQDAAGGRGEEEGPVQGDLRPERAGDRPLVPEPGRLGHEDRGPHRAQQGEHGRDHHPEDGAEAGMWGRVATRSSTHLPAAVATERDWGDDPIAEPSAPSGGAWIATVACYRCRDPGTALSCSPTRSGWVPKAWICTVPHQVRHQVRGVDGTAASPERA